MWSYYILCTEYLDLFSLDSRLFFMPFLARFYCQLLTASKRRKRGSTRGIWGGVDVAGGRGRWCSCDSTICQQHNSQFASFTSRFRSFGHCAVKRQLGHGRSCSSPGTPLPPPLLFLSAATVHWEYVAIVWESLWRRRARIIKWPLSRQFFFTASRVILLCLMAGEDTLDQGGQEEGGREVGRGTSVELMRYVTSFFRRSFCCLRPSAHISYLWSIIVQYLVNLTDSLRPPSLCLPPTPPLERYSCPLTWAISFKLTSLPLVLVTHVWLALTLGDLFRLSHASGTNKVIRPFAIDLISLLQPNQMGNYSREFQVKLRGVLNWSKIFFEIRGTLRNSLAKGLVSLSNIQLS